MLTAAASVKLKNNCKHDHKLTVTKYSMKEWNSYLHCLKKPEEYQEKNIYINLEGPFQIKNVYIF